MMIADRTLFVVCRDSPRMRRRFRLHFVASTGTAIAIERTFENRCCWLSHTQSDDTTFLIIFLQCDQGNTADFAIARKRELYIGCCSAFIQVKSHHSSFGQH